MAVAISKILNTATGSISKILGTTFTSVSGVLGTFTGSAAAAASGQFTLGLFDGSTNYRTGYHNSAITSIVDGGGNDIKFKLVYGSSVVDLTTATQASTQATGTGNSKKYSGVSIQASGSNATVSLVQVVTTAVAASTTVKVKIYTSTGFGGSQAPNALVSNGTSDATTISAATTNSFTWSGAGPTIGMGSYWIIFEDQSS